MQLHQIQIVGVVSNQELGVLITNEQISEGNWSFIECSMEPGIDWRNPLFLTIQQKTWINEVQFNRILWAQSFLPNILIKEAAFYLFVHVKTMQRGHERGYQWVKTIQDLEALALFHPLVINLCEAALNKKISLL